MTTPSCPCGDARLYTECCQLIHHDHSKALHPEQLMRARYSAYTLGLTDFIINTYHPSCQQMINRADIVDAANCQWQKLDVLNSSIESNNHVGFVEFKAHFIEQNQPNVLHEKSRFLLEYIQGQALWFYIDGIYPKQEKTRRNAPCICGSGKKFKRCCGS